MNKYILMLSAVLPFCALADVPSCGENCTYSYVQNGEDSNGNPTYTLKIEPIDSTKPASVKKYTRSYNDQVHYYTDAPWCFDTNITKLDIKEGITSIGAHAFEDMRTVLTTPLILPEGLQIIGKEAFHDTSITSVTFPSTLTELGRTSFAILSLEEVNGSFENLNKIDAAAFGYAKIKDLVIPANVTDFSTDVFGGERARGWWAHNIENLYCPATLAEQCAAAIAYREDNAQIKTYDFNGGVYVIKDDEGNETYYLSGDNMKNGEKATADEKADYVCADTLNNCKKQALINRGICTGDDCDALVASDGNYMLKFGGKTYQSINDLLRGNYDRRRIYTIEEANFVAGDKNRVSIRYK